MFHTSNLPEVVKPYGHLFDLNCELECVKGFVHKDKVDAKVPPVQQKLRRLPFSVRSLKN